MKLIVFTLLLAIAATVSQDVRRYRYIPPRYEDYEDVEVTPLSPTLNNALPAPAASPSSSTTQRPNTLPTQPPDAGQPEASETPQMPDSPTVGRPQDQSQTAVTGQGQTPIVGQGEGSNIGQGLQPDLNQGSNFGQGPDSDLNQGQRPDFGQGQAPEQGFQSVTPGPNPIPSPKPKPRPRPRPTLQPQPVFPGSKPVHNPGHGPAFSGPCGRFGCWGTQPVYPWGNWHNAPSGHAPQAVPYYPQLDYEDERLGRRYLPPKFW